MRTKHTEQPSRLRAAAIVLTAALWGVILITSLAMHCALRGAG